MSRTNDRNIEVMPDRLQAYERESRRREAWSRRSPSEPETREVVRTVKSKKGLLLLLPAAAIAGLGMYYSGLGKSLLASLPDYSGSVRRIGEEGATPAGEGMRIDGRGTGGFTPPTSPEEPPPAMPMGGAGRRPL